MKFRSSSLVERLSTVSSDCPELIRAEILDAMLDEVSAEMGMYFTCASDTAGEQHFTSGVFGGGDRELIELLQPFSNAPALDAPWLPPNTDPRSANTFVRAKSFYSTQHLQSYQVNASLLDPLEVGDQLRAVLFDGRRLLGWIGLSRRGVDERFSAEEEAKLVAAVDLIKAALAAADALESKDLEGGVFGVSNCDGVIEHSSQCLAKWLNPDRQAYLKRRIRATDGGTIPCGTEVFSGAKVRVTRLDGPTGVRYLITVERANIICIGPETWLTERQREIAEYAAAGATNAEIGRSLEISPHTVKTHMKSIYERLGVCTRQELAEALAE
ncbi:MAG: response regulator transcription factor [Bradymonadaceae bacterium]